MEKILVDTDAIIDFLRGYDKRIKTIFKRIEKGEIEGYLTWINVIEIYSGADVEEKELILRELLTLFKVLSEDWQTARLAGQLRRKYHLSLADSVIASFAIVNKLKLLTFNKRDFSKIKEIKFYEYL